MVDIKNATLIYQGGKRALDAVSLNLSEGDTCAVLGANGAGKSSLLWAIMGLLELSGGEILLDGVKVCKENAKKVRSIASLVFQNSDDQLFFPSVVEDVSFGLINSGLNEAEAEMRCDELLGRFGISHLKYRQNQHLSDGEKKKVAICTSLACSPKILLLDEPSALLDPRSKREMSEIVKSLEATVILTTHDIDFARSCCKYCLILKEGRREAFGEACKLLSDDKLMFECSLA